MSEKERNKAGLHKRISSIFSGVLIPQLDSDKEPSSTSIPEDADYAEPEQPAKESQKPESPKSNQTEQTLPEAESAQESEAKPANTPKFMTDQESKVVPIQETEFESPKDSEVELIQESNVESVQEPKAEQADTPEFVTAQESTVIPIQESEIEPAKESEAKPANTPKFVTDQESKVVPIQETEVEQAQESENEPAHQSKFNKDKKPKVIPVKESKKADIRDISKKASKKRSVVKVSSKSSWKQIISKLCEAKPGANTTKQKAMVVMVPVLFIVLVVFMLKGGVFGTSVHNVEAGDENNNVGVASAGLNAQIDWEIPEPYPTTLRDPMQLGPVVTGTNQAESRELVKIIVKSILYSEDNSSAIISNRIVHEGDQIQGASIVKINKDNVEFEMNGKKWNQGIQR